MDSRRVRAAGSAKTIAAMARRSSSPSGPSTPLPKVRAISRSAGEPRRTAARAIASASMTGAPRPRSAAANVLFPLAMPPVRPTRRTEGPSAPGGRGGRRRARGGRVRRGGSRRGGRTLRASGSRAGRLVGGLEADGLHRAVLGEEDHHADPAVEPDVAEIVGEGLLGVLPEGAEDPFLVQLGGWEYVDLGHAPVVGHEELGLAGADDGLLRLVDERGPPLQLPPGRRLAESGHHVGLGALTRSDPLPGAGQGSPGKGEEEEKRSDEGGAPDHEAL